MAIIVQKYGGTSLQTTEQIKQAAGRIIAEKEKGNQLVVVVSAMGDSTNRLVKLSREVSSCTNGREHDLLLSTGEQMSSALMALALQEKGQSAIALTGGQAGIEVEHRHGNARITAIHTNLLQRELHKGKIVIVAGFQGTTADGDICTLGRGGSDTTAAALAAALQADRCEICTDVDGVYAADPRIIPNAAKYASMDYESMLTMAEWGAGVIHPRAVAHAKDYQVPLVIRSSFNDHQGTWIAKDALPASVLGVTCQKGLGYLRLTGRVKKEKLLKWMSDSEVIGLKDSQPGELLMVIKDDDFERTLSRLHEHKNHLGIQLIQSEVQKAAIHLIFLNEEEKRKQSALLREAMFTPLEDVHSIETHPAVWSVAVPEEYGVEAARKVHEAFIGSNPNPFPLAY